MLRRAFEEQHAPDRQVDEALAKVYLETYDLTRSAAVLKVWARDFPDDPKPYLWWAEVHGRAADQQSMVENDYREALRRDPSLARADLGLAEELRKAHRNAEAAAEYDACLALEPNNAAAHLGAGRNLMEHGDEPAAARHLNRAMVLDPKNAEPYKELAEAASRRGDWAASLALLDRAVALDPYDVGVRNSRGLALSRLGRIDEARSGTGRGGPLAIGPRPPERVTHTADRLAPRLEKSASGRALDVRPRPRPGGRPVGPEDPRRTAQRPGGQPAARRATTSAGARPGSPTSTACTLRPGPNRPPWGASRTRETPVSQGDEEKRDDPEAAQHNLGSNVSVHARPPCPPRRRAAPVFLKVSLIAIGLVVLSGAATIALTDPEPATLPRRARQWLAAGSWRIVVASGRTAAIADEQVRPAWDEKFDDSGYPTAIRFTKPIDDPTSPRADSRVGRGKGPPGDRVSGKQARRPGSRRAGDRVDGGRHPPAPRRPL